MQIGEAAGEGNSGGEEVMDESNICDRCTCTYGDGDGALCPTCVRYLCYLCFGGMPTESPPDWKPEKKCIRCEHDRTIPAHPHGEEGAKK